MPQTIITNVSELTKDEIANLYFRSLGNTEMRKSHLSLWPPGVNRVPMSPSTQDVEIDFTCWYGGLLSLAYGIDPGVVLPTMKEMCQFIGPQFDRAKTAIAA